MINLAKLPFLVCSMCVKGLAQGRVRGAFDDGPSQAVVQVPS